MCRGSSTAALIIMNTGSDYWAKGPVAFISFNCMFASSKSLRTLITIETKCIITTREIFTQLSSWTSVHDWPTQLYILIFFFQTCWIRLFDMQEWIKEMAAHVKSIDNHHLLEVGLEGFYGESVPERQKYNPNNNPVGTDFITNNQIPDIDFATIHIYPEQW